MIAEVKDQNDEKLEDILKSIKGMIDNPDHIVSDSVSEIGEKVEKQDVDKERKHANDDDENILELTSVVRTSDGFDNNDILLSKKTQDETRNELRKFTEALEKNNYSTDIAPLDVALNNLMLPLMRNWLDSNLPKIVERVVTEEIKKMIPKSKNKKNDANQI